MSCMVNQRALPGHTDCRKDIVSCAHELPNPCSVELFDNIRGDFFQLVLEDDEAYEIECRFCVRPGKPLRRFQA